MSWLQNLLIKAQSNGLLASPASFSSSQPGGLPSQGQIQVQNPGGIPRPQPAPAREQGGSFAAKNGAFANVKRPQRSSSAQDLDQQMIDAGANYNMDALTTPPPINYPAGYGNTETSQGISASPPPGSPMNPMSGQMNGGMTQGSPFSGGNLGQMLANRRMMLQANPGMYFNDYSLFDYGGWMDYGTYGMGYGGGYGMSPMANIGMDVAANIVADVLDNTLGSGFGSSFGPF